MNLTANGVGGTITQTDQGRLTAFGLTVSAQGAVDLDEAANSVAILGTTTFRTAFGYRTGTSITVGSALEAVGGGNANISLRADTGNITLNAPVNAGTGTVTLEASAGSVTQAATLAGITAGRLEVTAGTDALLSATGAGNANAVAVLGGSTVGGTLSLVTTGDLALDGTIARSGAPGGVMNVTSGGTLTLNAGASLGFGDITLASPGAMTLRGTVGVTGQAVPFSTVRLGAGGNITQESGGAIVANLLGLRSGGAATLTAGTNDVRQLAANAVGTFAIATTDALATTSVTAVPLPGTANADLTGVFGASVSLSAADLTVGTGLVYATAPNGAVTLRADRLAVVGNVVGGALFGVDGLIDIAPRTLARPVSIGADGGPDTLFLSNATLGQLLSRTIVIGHDAPGAGTLTVGAPALAWGGVNSLTVRGGAIALESTFTLPAVNGLLTLRATSGDITQAATGAIDADRLSATAVAGSVLLGSPGLANVVQQVSGGAAAGEVFTFRADVTANTGTTYAVAAPGIDAAGAAVNLSAVGGGITQTTGARITADRLTVSAPGAVVLDGGGSLLEANLNSVTTLAPSSAAGITLRNAVALTVEGASATPRPSATSSRIRA